MSSPLIYERCRSSRISNYVAYKSAKRTGPVLRFLDIEEPNAPRQPVFKDEQTGLPKRSSRKKIPERNCVEPEAKIKPQTEKRSGEKPAPKQQRGMMFRTSGKKKLQSRHHQAMTGPPAHRRLRRPRPSEETSGGRSHKILNHKKHQQSLVENRHKPDRQLWPVLSETPLP